MERRIPARYETEVYMSEAGNICLKQIDPLGDEPAVIVLAPVDVPKVIQWLQELHHEAQRHV